MKELVGTVNAIHYIESLGQNTKILSHSVNGMFHYIITEYEELPERKESEFNMYMKELIKQWCTTRKVYHSKYSNVFTSSKMLLDSFNDWNESNISHKLFIPLFKEVAKDGGTNLEITRLRVNGELEYGFIGVKINGCYSKEL